MPVVFPGRLPHAAVQHQVLDDAAADESTGAHGAWVPIDLSQRGGETHGVSTRGVRGCLARYDPRHCLSPAGSCEQRPGLEAEADVATVCAP